MNRTAYQSQKIFFALGTVCTLTVFGSDALHALDRAKARVMEIHNAMNAYDPDSEVSRINRNAGVGFVTVSYPTLQLIGDSVAYSKLTAGGYDITTRPISALWKTAIKSHSLPKQNDIEEATALTDYRDILIDRAHSAVMLRRRGQQIDLGAIAKGYAADEVRRIFLIENVTDAIINLGGTVINMGRTRRVGLQNPFGKTGETFSFIDVADKAVVSSGVYEQGFVKDGVTYHHIIDPKTGYPSASPLAGVTLVGDSAAHLDALSTAVCATSLPEAIALLKRCGAEAIFVTKAGEVFTTQGINCNIDIERRAVA